MIGAIRSELRKLLSLRSTYLYILAAALLVIFYAGYAQGVKADKGMLANHGLLASEVTGAVSAISIFGALVALLLVAHEYRYNTITYTLTAARNRSRVLLAKIIAVSCFIVIFTLIMGVLSPLMTVAGIHLKGLTLVSQTLPYGSLLWHSLFFGWGYAMFAMIIATLLRNQVGSIVAFLLIPTTVETILHLLLKANTKYLPFTSLHTFVDDQATAGDFHRALWTVLGYVVGGWLVAWLLFVRRDAN